MPSKYPILKPREIIDVLEKFGFQFVSQKGTLKSILNQAGIEIDEFLNFLGK